MSYPKNRKSSLKHLKKKALDMYKSGLSSIQVGKKLGISSTTICSWVRKEGVNRTFSEVNKLRGAIPPSQKGKKRSLKTRLKISGSKNHFWKGGISSLAKRLRMSQKMINWRNKVYKRDNYTCQICDCVGRNYKGKSLNVHHLLITVKYMVNKFKTLKDCFNYKPFWKLSNGTTLCESCHKNVHRYQEKI